VAAGRHPPLAPLRNAGMPSNRRSTPLPEKTCPVCRRPFAWRRKWAKTWAEVKYCSAACRSGAGVSGFRPR
jgi:hypothetical protein